MKGPSRSENAPFFVDTEVLRLTQNGVWLTDGIEITHEPTRKLFSRSLIRDEQGYLLEVGYEKKRVEVEDTAFFVLRIEGAPEGGIQVHLSDETHEPLIGSTLSYRPGRLTCRIKNGTEEAKFLHSPYFDLLRNLEEDHDAYFLNLKNERIELSRK